MILRNNTEYFEQCCSVNMIKKFHIIKTYLLYTYELKVYIYILYLCSM